MDKIFLKRDKITNLLPEKKQEELYRRIFSSVDGQMVLADILIDLCYFDENEDETGISKEEKNYLKNYGCKLLRKCGVIKSKNIQQLVKAMMKMPVK